MIIYGGVGFSGVWKVKDKNENYIGLPEKIYSLKPAKTSGFTY